MQQKSFSRVNRCCLSLDHFLWLCYYHLRILKKETQLDCRYALNVPDTLENGHPPLPPLKEIAKMNKATKSLFVVVLLAAVVVLAGCTLSASRPPNDAPTATSELLFMTETPGGEGLASDIATQTAQALQPSVATETPVPAEATQAPAAEATQAPAEQQQQSAAVAVPTLTRPGSYTLQKGEFPFCIARRYDLNVGSLLSANGMNMNSKPAVGTVLVIPSSGTFDGERALRTDSTYTVKSGDTIYTIACYFGDVSPEAIIAVNGLDSSGSVQSGQVLQIP
jgi:LysM repeat protein